jgi:cobalamin biosynthesis protein CbiG
MKAYLKDKVKETAVHVKVLLKGYNRKDRKATIRDLRKLSPALMQKLVPLLAGVRAAEGISFAGNRAVYEVLDAVLIHPHTIDAFEAVYIAGAKAVKPL